MNGIIIVNKPKDYTSHDIVNIVRKKLNTKKVGHTGTLDPNATGVLPILVGTATKTSKYLIEHKKTYIATIKLGQKTDTGDTEGEIIEEQKNIKAYTKKEIENVLNSFIGKKEQIPPMFSAIKIKGKKLYDYAREGKEVKLEPRKIEIYSIKLLDYKNNEIVFKVECSKGTYIRVLSEDIAKELGTIGHMKELKRIAVDKFKIEDSISIDELEGENINKKIISIEKVFEDKPRVDLDLRNLELFLNGVMLTYNLEDGIYAIYNNEKFIGLGIVKKELLKRDVIV